MNRKRYGVVRFSETKWTVVRWKDDPAFRTGEAIETQPTKEAAERRANELEDQHPKHDRSAHITPLL